MIHTDGRPTIANCGPIPGLDAEQEAPPSLGDASTEQTSPDLGAALLSDDTALD